jgi:hypothetical protein
VHRDYFSHGRISSTSTSLCVATTHLPVARVLHQLRRAPRLLVVRLALTLLRLCRASGHTISPLDFSSVGRTGSHHASGHCISRREYSSFGLRRLYCAYATRLGASACCAARRQLIRLRHASGCLGTSRGSWPVVDYFDNAARLGASAHRAARHADRRAARRQLLRVSQAHR